MKENKLYTLVTENTVTVFWYKPLDAADFVRYKVYLDGDLRGETDRTHFTVDKLKPNHKYKIKVEYITDKKQGKYQKIDKISFVTNKEKKIINVTKAPFNAVGDGETMNTKALQMAIDAADEKVRIYIPEGVYMTGALHLHSNMEIYLEKGAVIRGTDNPRDYLPKIPSRFEGIEMFCYSSLINMGTMDHSSDTNCENVLIFGEGTIESGGKALAENIINEEKKSLDLENVNLDEYEKAETLPGRARPRLINISNSKNVRISGLKLKNGASWNVHMIYSENVVTDNCEFYSKDVWNGDGWDPDSSRDSVIFGCRFYTGDDAIAIKSGKNPEGNIINIPTRNISIFDCISEFGHGIIIGSEMSGGIENIEIWDCDITNSSSGFEIKTTRKRGGYVKNISVRDSGFSRIIIHGVGYNDDGEPAASDPKISDCHFNNVNIIGKYLDEDDKRIGCNAIEIEGFSDMKGVMSDIYFDNINIFNGSSISLKNTNNIHMNNINTEMG